MVLSCGCKDGESWPRNLKTKYRLNTVCRRHIPVVSLPLALVDVFVQDQWPAQVIFSDGHDVLLQACRLPSTHIS